MGGGVTPSPLMPDGAGGDTLFQNQTEGTVPVPRAAPAQCDKGGITCPSVIALWWRDTYAGADAACAGASTKSVKKLVDNLIEPV